MFRVANVSGFYPDWFPAMEQQLAAGDVDVLTGDYLAELTMGILSFTEQKGYGYARNFVQQLEAGALKTAAAQGVKIIANAGGLQPERCAREVERIAQEQNLRIKVAWVEGDDLRGRVPELLAAGHLTADHDLAATSLTTANAYFGCWPIVAALDAGADVVVTGRCTDASPLMAAAAWKFGWSPTDYDQLAGALVAGHILECGGQATGGNYPFFAEVDTFDNIGFPIAELEADGACTITKPAGTGGVVTRDTVTAQLLYEVGSQAYLNPDVTARLDTAQLADAGTDRVRITGVRGGAPPDTLKVCCTLPGGFRHVVGVRTCGPNVDAKLALLSHQVWDAVGGTAQFDDWIEYRIGGGPASDSAEANLVDLYFGVRSNDRRIVGRAFANAIVQLALRSVPGMTLLAPPGDASPVLVCRSAALARDAVDATVHFAGVDAPLVVPHAMHTPVDLPPPLPLPTAAPRTGTVLLADVVGARSGDKGGDANVGVWVRSEADLAVVHAIDAAFVAEATRHPVEQIDMYDFPNLLGRNFVLRGYLGDGAGTNLKPDAQAKTLGEFLRAQTLTL